MIAVRCKAQLFSVLFAIMAAFGINVIQALPASAHEVPQTSLKLTCDALTGSYNSFPNAWFNLTAVVKVGNDSKTYVKQYHGPSGNFSFDVSGQTHNLGTIHASATLNWIADGGPSTPPHIEQDLTCGTPVQEWKQTPSVTCDAITIDPPSWLKVTFFINVNGVSYVRTVDYGQPPSDPHNARVIISDLTAGIGTKHIVVHATMPFVGVLLVSHTANVTLVCHQPPPVLPTISSTLTGKCGEVRSTVTSEGGNVPSLVILRSSLKGELLHQVMADKNEVLVDYHWNQGGTDNIVIEQGDAKGHNVKPVLRFTIKFSSLASCQTPPPAPKPPVQPNPQPPVQQQLPFTGSPAQTLTEAALALLAIGLLTRPLWRRRPEDGIIGVVR